MVKIGKLKADNCGIGVMGTGAEIGEAEITNTGIAAWDGTLQPHPGPPGPHHVDNKPGLSNGSGRRWLHYPLSLIATVAGGLLVAFLAYLFGWV